MGAILSALAAGVLSLRLYSEYLQPAEYGVVIVALQILSCLPLLDGGFRMTINQRILTEPPAEERRRLLEFCQAVYSYIGLLALAAAVLVMIGYGATRVGRQAGQPLGFFLLLGIAGTLSVLNTAQTGLLIGLRAQAQVFWLAALGSWLNLAVLWRALEQGAGLWSFPLATLAAVLGTFPLALWLIRRLEPGLKLFRLQRGDKFREMFGRLKSDAWACFRSQVSILMLFTVDVILVGFLCGPREAAIYGVLTRLFGIVRSFLQAASEVAWPTIAERNLASAEFAQQLLRANGWVYGAVMGALLPTLLPFLGWFMGEAWVPSRAVLWLVTARFLISGLSSPAAYALVGLGRFGVIARCIERELLAACLFSAVFAGHFGVGGVALGFLLATVFGTLLPILAAFAAALKLRLPAVLGQVWWRAAAALGSSAGAAALLEARLPGRGSGLIAGMTAALGAVALGIAISWVRLRTEPSAAVAPVTLRNLMRKI